MTERPPSDAGLAAPGPILPISALNRLARERLESLFPLCWVSGEISNLTYAASGHVYFSLKDAYAQVRCVMFRNRAQLLGWRLENGQHIEARVLVTLYEARGDFQLNVETARRAGIGNLYEQFLRLKTHLEKEGLFAPQSKRLLPDFPVTIGIITSPQAAALRDILTTLKRRAPHIRLIVYPTMVQGEGAAQQIATALREANARSECDVLLLCRGGGSLEDLWAFNDEHLARAIRASRIPVITGIGHETDFTIADFAADQRAPTPTAAAELAAPQRRDLQERLYALRTAATRAMESHLEQRSQRLDLMARRLIHPQQRLLAQHEALLNLRRRLNAGLTQAHARGRNKVAELTHRLLLSRPQTEAHARRIDTLSLRIRNAWQQHQTANTNQLARLSANLMLLNPTAVLARGYSIVTDEAGHIVRDSHSLEPNSLIGVSLHSGRLEARINSVIHATAPSDNNDPAAR